MPGRTTPTEAKVRWVRRETRDTFTVSLALRDREFSKKYRFTPGQFNMLSLPGIGEAPISISSAPSDHDLTHTIRIAGDVTNALSMLRAGDVLGLRGPFGTGWPMDELEGREFLIMAGGLGIAPLRSVIRQIFRGTATFRPAGIPRIMYGARTPKDVIFRDELPRYRDAFETLLTVDRADPEVYWKGSVGTVTTLLDRITMNPLNTVAFLCGPEVMMDATAQALLIRGVPEEKIFLSMERTMNCGMGICGHCFFGPKFVCKDGPVFRFADVAPFLAVKEI